MKTQIQIHFNTLKYNKTKERYDVSISDFLLNEKVECFIPQKIKKKWESDVSELVQEICADNVVCEKIVDYFNIMMKDRLKLTEYIKSPKYVIYRICDSELAKLGPSKTYLNSKLLIGDLTRKFNFPVLSKERFNLPDLPGTLAHFSFQVSCGELLLLPLRFERSSNVLSEFALLRRQKGQYRDMVEFFASHICDSGCKRMGLLHPRKKESRNDNEKINNIFCFKYLSPLRLCSACSMPVSGYIPEDKNEYKYNLSNNISLSKDGAHVNSQTSPLLCTFCSELEPAKRRKALCTECKHTFFFSGLLFASGLRNFPVICENCDKSLS